MCEGLLDGSAGDIEVFGVCGGEVAHHAAGERVTGAGRVNDGFDGVCGEHGDAFVVDEDAAVLTFLDDDEHRAHFVDDFAARGDGVADAGEEMGLFIVDDEAVDVGHEFGEGLTLVLDPEVHGVCDGEDAVGEGVEEFALDAGMRVAEEDELGVAVFFGCFGGVLGEDAEFGVEGFAGVPVVEILAAPCKGARSLADFESFDVDVGESGEEGVVIFVEIFTGGGDEADFREEGGGCGEIDAGTAEDFLDAGGGGLDAVDTDGAGDDEGHVVLHGLKFFRSVPDREL